MKDKTGTEGQFLIGEERGRKTIILIRWILIIVVGYLVVFGSLGQSPFPLPYFLFVVYALSNLLLMSTPARWFEGEIPEDRLLGNIRNYSRISYPWRFLWIKKPRVLSEQNRDKI